MVTTTSRLCTAFAGTERLATGGLRFVAAEVRRQLDAGEERPVVIIDNQTSEVIDLDLRGTPEQVAARIPETPEVLVPPKARKRGRPKLGVIAREVTLLPRHWEWLSEQPGGASVALRRLVDVASKEKDPEDRRRRAQNAVYRFMTTIGGDLPDYEEALRALYADDAETFRERIAQWPADVVAHLHKLAPPAFSTVPTR